MLGQIKVRAGKRLRFRVVRGPAGGCGDELRRIERVKRPGSAGSQRRIRRQGRASIYLFDTDAFGNGTSDVIRRNLYLSAVERVPAGRGRRKDEGGGNGKRLPSPPAPLSKWALGGGADALPTLDMARCLEEEFQECENSHAAHLAYHDLEPHDASLASLPGSFRSERRVAGRVVGFVRNNLRIISFDHVAAFQACPEPREV